MSPSKNKILVWAVILLMIANVALLATTWYFHHHGPQRPNGPAEYLAKELRLSKQQKDQLHVLASQHHRQALQIQADIKNARDSFFNLLSQTHITDSLKQQAAARIANRLEALELLTFDHFQQVRTLCNGEQQKKFDEIIHHVLEIMGPPREREPYGPEMRPHGPPPDN